MQLLFKRPHLGSTMSISSCYDSGVRVTSESILLEKWINMVVILLLEEIPHYLLSI